MAIKVGNTTCELIDKTVIQDERGNINILQSESNVPFLPKRMYWICHPTGVRGNHAHKTTYKVLIVFSGSLKISLDNFHDNATVDLFAEGPGLLLPPLVWREITDFTEDCIFGVLANTHYNEDDYIRSRTEFEKLVKCKKLNL